MKKWKVGVSRRMRPIIVPVAVIVTVTSRIRLRFVARMCNIIIKVWFVKLEQSNASWKINDARVPEISLYDTAAKKK